MIVSFDENVQERDCTVLFELNGEFDICVHENIKFISTSQRVMFFLLYGVTNSTKAKGGNRDVIER